MKQIMILVIAMACGALNGQTTIEEYNYVTKGYKIQLESGLDMKKGYRVEYLNEHTVTFTEKDKKIERKTTFYGLYRNLEKSPCALMLLYENNDSGQKKYMCIPHYNSSGEIWDAYFKDLINSTEAGLKALSWGLSKSAAFFAQNN